MIDDLLIDGHFDNPCHSGPWYEVVLWLSLRRDFPAREGPSHEVSHDLSKGNYR